MEMIRSTSHYVCCETRIETRVLSSVFFWAQFFRSDFPFWFKNDYICTWGALNEFLRAQALLAPTPRELRSSWRNRSLFYILSFQIRDNEAMGSGHWCVTTSRQTILFIFKAFRGICVHPNDAIRLRSRKRFVVEKRGSPVKTWYGLWENFTPDGLLNRANCSFQPVNSPDQSAFDQLRPSLTFSDDRRTLLKCGSVHQKIAWISCMTLNPAFFMSLGIFRCDAFYLSDKQKKRTRLTLLTIYRF